MAKLKDIEDVVSHTCRHCKWWHEIPKPAQYEWFDRQVEAFVAKLGDCSAEFWNIGYDVDQTISDGVAVEGDEGWGCYTGPDFGCVHWEAK